MMFSCICSKGDSPRRSCRERCRPHPKYMTGKLLGRSLDEAALSKASRDAVCDAVFDLSAQWDGKSWLAVCNPYRSDAIGRVRDAYEKAKTRKKGEIEEPDLVDYIAVSAFVHCFDGWTFLARALESELAGNPGVAMHLAYYAELRARRWRCWLAAESAFLLTVMR